MTTAVQDKNATERKSAKYPREDKQAVVAEIKAFIENSQASVFTEYRGLTVAQLADLRAELREQGTEYKVYKNSLVRIAATSAGYDLNETLIGPVAVAFAKTDAAGTAKTLKNMLMKQKYLLLRALFLVHQY